MSASWDDTAAAWYENVNGDGSLWMHRISTEEHCAAVRVRRPRPPAALGGARLRLLLRLALRPRRRGDESTPTRRATTAELTARPRCSLLGFDNPSRRRRRDERLGDRRHHRRRRRRRRQRRRVVVDAARDLDRRRRAQRCSAPATSDVLHAERDGRLAVGRHHRVDEDVNGGMARCRTRHVISTVNRLRAIGRRRRRPARRHRRDERLVQRRHHPLVREP